MFLIKFLQITLQGLDKMLADCAECCAEIVMHAGLTTVQIARGIAEAADTGDNPDIKRSEMEMPGDPDR